MVEKRYYVIGVRADEPKSQPFYMNAKLTQ